MRADPETTAKGKQFAMVPAQVAAAIHIPAHKDNGRHFSHGTVLRKFAVGGTGSSLIQSVLCPKGYEAPPQEPLDLPRGVLELGVSTPDARLHLWGPLEVQPLIEELMSRTLPILQHLHPEYTWHYDPGDTACIYSQINQKAVRGAMHKGNVPAIKKYGRVSKGPKEGSSALYKACGMCVCVGRPCIRIMKGHFCLLPVDNESDPPQYVTH